MEIPEDLYCVFSARVESDDDGPFVRLPSGEFERGQLASDATYRIAVYPHGGGEEPEERESAGRAVGQEPPVSEGDRLDVEIESIGDQGDGIARVDRGFVIIVPDTDVAERVEVEISDVRENVAFAEVVERYHPLVD